MLQQLHLGAPGGKDEKAREITMTPGEKGLFPPGGKGLAAGWEYLFITTDWKMLLRPEKLGFASRKNIRNYIGHCL